MKRILCVSDLHCGSIHGLKFKGELNAFQKIYEQKWHEMCDSGRFRACFVLGDVCDGVNRKGEGYELYTASRIDQVEEAANRLSEVKTSVYRGCHGSDYHSDENTSMDLMVMKELHGEFGTDLSVTVDQYRFHLGHTISAAKNASHEEILASILNEKHFGHFDMLLRGHLHKYVYTSLPDGQLCVVPGWKGRDSFAKKRGLRYGPPVCGWVVLNLYDTGIQVEPHLFILEKEHMFKEVTA
jgi:predicted phosphodiesterase